MLGRSLRRVMFLPGTGLGIVRSPAGPADRLSLRWEFWWQAHLLDCAVDAWLRDPNRPRAATVAKLVRSIKLRNLGRFTNDYYDDMAWIGLALQRAAAAGAGDARALRLIVTRILDAWSPPIGGIPWRAGDDFYNAPANGPAAILLARNGFLGRAQQMADWIDANLRASGSDLIADGFHPGETMKPVYYSYCQGVVLGAEVELARLRGDPSRADASHADSFARDRSRAHRLVAAVQSSLATAGVLHGHGGGNGGLFTGILARYLALLATELPGNDPADEIARATAARLVIDSAEAAWSHSFSDSHGPVFGPDWSRPTVLPGRASSGRRSNRAVTGADRPERDLSVQLSGWMVTEAAALLLN